MPNILYVFNIAKQMVVWYNVYRCVIHDCQIFNEQSFREDQLMQKHKTNAPFAGTKEQGGKLLKLIEEQRYEKGALMPILQGAQEIYGYLPIEVQQIIADEMKMPLEEVYGVVTFYS